MIVRPSQYNYAAKNSGLDIEAAKKKKWETTASGLPQINAGLDYTNNFVLQCKLDITKLVVMLLLGT